MAAKPKAPARAVELYEKMIASQPGIQRKGAANPYTSMNGNMFSFLTARGVALRFDEDRREELIRKKKGKVCISYGAVMRGYVEFPQSILSKTAQANRLFAQSVAFARSLAPKPTNPKKKATKKKSSAKTKSKTQTKLKRKTKKKTAKKKSSAKSKTKTKKKRKLSTKRPVKKKASSKRGVTKRKKKSRR